MTPGGSGSEHFARLLRGETGIDLARINLEIAADAYPGLEPGPWLGRIEALAHRVAARCASGSTWKSRLAQINWVLFIEEEFRGDRDTYDDPANSYLNEVIERRLGIPISLSVLYLGVAERLGLALRGVNFPAHFLLRHAVEPWFIDPFNEGQVFGVEGCRERFELLAGATASLLDESMLAPCGDEVIVARMLRNLKSGYLRRGDFEGALLVQQRLAALCRDEPTETRDLGVLLLQVDRPGAAIRPLQDYLESSPATPDRDAIRGMLSRARRELAARN